MQPDEVGLWITNWAMLKLGAFCLGMALLHGYSKGREVVVPASAQHTDHLMWALFFVGIVGGIAVLCTLSVVYQLRNNRTRRQECRGS